MAKKAQVVSKDAKIEPVDLPEPGYKRDEVLAKRKDDLEQQIDEMSDDVLTIDPSVFKGDREIRYMLDRDVMDIPVGPEYKVQWVNYRNGSGNHVYKAMRKGWVTLNQSMIKGGTIDPSLVSADGSLRVGDVMAMIIPISRYDKLLQANEEKVAKFENRKVSELQHLAKGYDGLNIVDLSNNSDAMGVVQRRAANSVAANHLGNMMKQGTIPGVPIR